MVKLKRFILSIEYVIRVLLSMDRYTPGALYGNMFTSDKSVFPTKWASDTGYYVYTPYYTKRWKHRIAVLKRPFSLTGYFIREKWQRYQSTNFKGIIYNICHSNCYQGEKSIRGFLNSFFLKIKHN